MSENERKRKRQTSAQKKNERADFAEKEARTKEWISNQASRAK
ncbi:hypothetical protein [Escherichia coli]|nr:hypothetical protein [Escherichia coli]